MHSFNGLWTKYEVDRPLPNVDRTYHLRHGQTLNAAPHLQTCVARMNATCLELVDKWYAGRGAGLAWFAIGMPLLFAFFYWVDEDDRFLDPVFWGFFTIGLSPLWAFAAFVVRKDVFGYTHYPIRFNRVTRMVHVFRADGTVLSVAWSRIFFCMVYLQDHENWEVRGHLLTPDNATIQQTFALSQPGWFDRANNFHTDPTLPIDDEVHAHWEFVRRYMEEGPEEVLSQVPGCMRSDPRSIPLRRIVRDCLSPLAGDWSVRWWIALPFYLINICIVLGALPFRFVAMHASKTPRWPDDIEASCAVMAGDPYAIEGDAEGERVALFPEAALAAGVGAILPPYDEWKRGRQSVTPPPPANPTPAKRRRNNKRRNN